MRSKFSFGGSGSDDFPGFDMRGLSSYVRVGKLSSVFFTPGTEETIADPIVPTLPPTHDACATHPYAQQYCCGSLCLSGPAARISPSAFPSVIFCFILFYLQTQAGVPGKYHHHLSPCCFCCRCVLLCVIHQCHCSSCARHSAPTVQVGSIRYACTLSTTVLFVVVIGIWPAHTYLLVPAAVCDWHFMHHTDP